MTSQLSQTLTLLACLCGLGTLSLTATSVSAATQRRVAPTQSAIVQPAGVQIAQTPGTIVDVASGNDNFETLVTAVRAADLVSTLSGDGPFTVFAPTDAAFAALPDGVLEELLKPQNRDLLTQVLAYHVVPDRVRSNQLSTGKVETLNGGVAVLVRPDGVVVNNASVVVPDVDASNGVIHAINRVLIPQGVAEQLALRARQTQPAQQPVRALW